MGRETYNYICGTLALALECHETERGSVTNESPPGADNAEAIGLTKEVLKLKDRTLRGRNMNIVRPVGGH